MCDVAAFLVQIFPWETEFMNNALWSPRGARAGERTRTAGGTLIYTVVISAVDPESDPDPTFQLVQILHFF
jgi:hypothetical protein